jgi:hypothetical protein
VFVVLAGLLAAAAGDVHAQAGRGFLVVADTVEQRIFVYRIPEMVLTGEIPNVLLGAHLGTLALPDGRILLSDDQSKEILALRIDETGVPTIVNRVAATLGRRAVWGSVDARLRFLAVASELEGTDEQVINVIDLATFENREARVQMTGEGEAHPFLTGRPLALFVSLGGELNAYRDSLAPLNRTPIQPGSHGPVVSPKTGARWRPAAPSTCSGMSTAAPAVRISDRGWPPMA